MNHPVAQPFRPKDTVPYQEYNLEVQAKIDENIGDHQVRYARALELVGFLSSIRFGPVMNKKFRQFQELVVREFGQKAVVQTHGIYTERRLWTSVEMDELVIGINRGYNVGIDELGAIYGLHGNRVGIELITTHQGVLYQNSNQLTTPEWWEKMERIIVEMKEPPLMQTN
jgi:hypothetical protein